MSKKKLTAEIGGSSFVCPTFRLTRETENLLKVALARSVIVGTRNTMVPLFSDTPPSPHSVIVRFTVNKSCTRWCHIPTAFAPLALRGYLVLIAGVMSLCSQLGCTENNVTSGHRSGILPHEISYFIYIIYIHINGYVIFLSVIVIIIAKLASSLSLSGDLVVFSLALLIALRAYSNWIVCGWNRELLTFCHVCLSLLSLALLALLCSLAMNTSGASSSSIDDFIEIFLWPVSLSQLGLVVPLAINANLQHLEFTRDFN